MRKFYLLSAIVAAPLAANAADLTNDYTFIQDNAPPAVQRSVVGHLELSVGWEKFDIGKNAKALTGFPEEFGRFEGWGRVNVPFGQAFNLELETGGSAIWNKGKSQSGIGAYGHLWGGANSFRAGGFGGIDFASGNELATGGIEAEVDIGNLTLGAQGTYSSFLDCSGCPDVWGARAWADLYIASNTRLGIEGVYWDVSNVPPGPGITSEIWGVSGTAEHRFAGTPMSVFVRGDYEKAFDSIDTVVVSGGIRVFMDGGLSLEDHDHQVPFNVRQPLLLELTGSGPGSKSPK